MAWTGASNKFSGDTDGPRITWRSTALETNQEI